MKKIELLSPAGNKESLKAAIYAGCDAVYLGGKHFGARNYAENFNLEELEEAVNLAHLYGVKVYITVNTIVYEEEVTSFLKYIENLVNIHVDALIMQDLGMIDLVKQTYQNIEIHASTQMNIHSLDGVHFIESLGIKRVVLARETNIKEIKKIKEKSNIEIEVFAHGALCMGYSGECLMSYFVGKRSGNRGMCAGTCRQKYELRDINMKYLDKGYLLSMKDLNVLENLDTLIEHGIDSLKIEGRMKKPSYIFFITSIYRKAIDSYYQTGKINITKEDIKNITLLYNRMFTKGYILNEKREEVVNTYKPNHMGIPLGKIEKVDEKRIWIHLEEDLNMQDGIRILNEKEDQGFLITQMKENGKEVKYAKKGFTIEIKKRLPIKKGDTVIKTTDAKLEKQIEEQIKQKTRRIEIKGKITIQENKKITLSVKDQIHYIEVESKEKIEKAKKRITTKDEVLKQLNKLGNTPYIWNQLEIKLEEGLFIPNILLNTIRREAIEAINKKRLERPNLIKGIYEKEVPNFSKEQKKGASFFYPIEEKEKQNYDYVYTIDKKENTLYQLPRIVEDYQKYKTEKEVLVSEVGALSYFPNKNTDFTFRVVNSYTLAYLHNIGVKRVTLSYELNEKQIQNIINAYQKRYKQNPNVEVIVYGYEDAMITKHNLLSPYNIKEAYLIDKYKNKYYIKENRNYTTIYHYQKMDDKPYERYYHYGVNAIRFLYIKK